MAERPQGSTTGVIIIILVLALLGAGAWYMFMYKPEQEAKEKARLEQIAKEEAAKKLQEEQKARFEKLIIDANADYDQENWMGAKMKYSEANSIFPNEQFPKDRLDLVNAKLDEAAALEARKAAGVVETVDSPTGRYYVVVSSSIDEDLAMDYASKLAKEGNVVKILKPNNTSNKLFHRVSLADFDTYEAADAASSTYSQYGSGVWVLRN